jgi:hypothetical protein
MNKLEPIDWCMLVCAGAMLACISDVLAVHFGAPQESIRTSALAGADVAGLVLAVTGFRHR